MYFSSDKYNGRRNAGVRAENESPIEKCGQRLTGLVPFHQAEALIAEATIPAAGVSEIIPEALCALVERVRVRALPLSGRRSAASSFVASFTPP